MTAAVSSLPFNAAPSLGAVGMSGASNSTAFAQMLDAEQAQQPAQSQSQSADKPKEAANGEAKTSDNERAKRMQAQRLANRLPNAEPQRDAQAEPVDGLAVEDEALAVNEATDDERDVVVDPAIADWLARLSSSDERSTLGQGKAAGDEPGLLDETAARGAKRAALPGGAGAQALRQQEDLAGSEAHELASQQDRQQAVEAVEALVSEPAPAQLVQAQAQTAVAEGFRVDAAPTPGAVAAMAAPGATDGAAAPSESAPVPQAHVPTPTDSPEFPKALGTQLSVLARDGIEKAQLNLNPADMGPISVQIVLDGERATVDFGADSAQTRQLIEAGLPELAAAMREAGFTLSGGGVHSQAQGQRGQAQAGPSAGAGGVREGAADEPAAARTVHVQRAGPGGVDLYA